MHWRRAAKQVPARNGGARGTDHRSNQSLAAASRTRRRLLLLDDRALDDVGMGHMRRDAECRKWFWQE
jgi:uncharacterized protein YjiS (DUF1127 family)